MKTMTCKELVRNIPNGRRQSASRQTRCPIDFAFASTGKSSAQFENVALLLPVGKDDSDH
jgi:hypothetical protein